ncbi:MAG TPA: RimK/LysX family protein [Polyangia bacterium]|jgi:predicted deacylase|nr:RimK/LysX family protein [Polyangia bacterium]
MTITLPVRGLRVGGVTIAPGSARAVDIPLAPRPARAKARGSAARAIPAWVAVGAKAGPRIAIVAAPRGTESAAAAAARGLARGLDPATMAGSVVIVPVLRPGGRFAPRRLPGVPWRFPGDASGAARARDAFTLFSELVVGAGAFVQLGAPRGGRRAALTVAGDLDDPRVRRLAAGSGALVARHVSRATPGTLASAAREAGVVALELAAADTPVDETGATRALEGAALTVLEALGVTSSEGAPGITGVAPAGPAPPLRPRPEPPPVLARRLRVRAPAGGLVEAAVAPGAFVRAGGLLARVAPTLPGRAVPVKAPVDALVLEAPARPATRKGTALFVLAPLPAGTRRPRVKAGAPGGGARGAPPRATRGEPAKLRAGWVEHVTLPELAIPRLKAKLDTGARTSALHVVRMRTVDTAGGPLRRPILEMTVPSGARGRKPQRVRAAVRGYVVVRDTSGRLERRPVIETALRLGPIKKRIAVTLTNRGDMLYPMLIGRTALGSNVVVDPARRYLLGSSPR